MKKVLPISRFFVLSVFMILTVGLLMTACSNQAGSSNASASSSTSSSQPGADEAAERGLVGSWELVEITSSNEESGEGGVSPEAVQAKRDKGLENYLVLNSDHSAVYAINGSFLYGSWERDSKLEERGVGLGAKVSFETQDGRSGNILAVADGSDLLVSMGPSSGLYKYAKVDDKNPLPKAEYEQAIGAFVGKWHVTSATRDGVTITKEAGQIPVDLTMEFKSDMTVTLVNGEQSLDAPWGILSANSGFVFNPIDGDLLTITDGVMTEDLGAKGSMSYVKE